MVHFSAYLTANDETQLTLTKQHTTNETNIDASVQSVVRPNPADLTSFAGVPIKWHAGFSVLRVPDSGRGLHSPTSQFNLSCFGLCTVLCSICDEL